MSETHSDHKDEHGHDEHHEKDKKHGDAHGSEHGAGHGDAHGGHAEHGAGHGAGHGGHGGGHGHHGHSEFDQYKHEPRKPATPEQRAALMRIAAENAKKLRAKNRVEVLRAIEALQKNHDIQQELGPLILQLRIEIFNILEK